MSTDEHDRVTGEAVQAGQAAAEARLAIALQDLGTAMQEILDIV